MTELKYCPVCGRTEVIEKHYKGFYVVCLICHERTSRCSTAKVARTKWNNHPYRLVETLRWQDWFSGCSEKREGLYQIIKARLVDELDLAEPGGKT